MPRVGYAVGSIDELGDGVFRKVRQALGVTAFGANGMVLEPGTGWFSHYHDEQDELYFVHSGLAGFEVDGSRLELGPAASSTWRRRRRDASGTPGTRISSS